jgi:Trypsin-co-occurring domain 2
MDSDSRVPLADAIKSLRTELSEAMKQGTDEDLRFRLGPIELEFQLNVSREYGGDGGIKFWVVSLGAKASRASSTAHTIKLVLNPLIIDDASGDEMDAIISDQMLQPPE